MKENLAGTMYISAQKIMLQNAAVPIHLYHFLMRWNFLQWACTQLSPQTYIFFSSLFLGYRRAEPLEIHNQLFVAFKFWGIAHYIARSGLHLGILILLWQLIFSYVPLPWKYRQYIIIGVIGCYFLCSWSSVSFLRAFLSFFIGRIFALSKQSCLFIHSLSLTVACMLLANPVTLFFLDFQLSFGMTYALAWLQIIRNKHLSTKPLQNR
jgi:competence protein ComEC